MTGAVLSVGEWRCRLPTPSGQAAANPAGKQVVSDSDPAGRHRRRATSERRPSDPTLPLPADGHRLLGHTMARGHRPRSDHHQGHRIHVSVPPAGHGARVPRRGALSGAGDAAAASPRRAPRAGRAPRCSHARRAVCYRSVGALWAICRRAMGHAAAGPSAAPIGPRHHRRKFTTSVHKIPAVQGLIFQTGLRRGALKFARRRGGPVGGPLTARAAPGDGHSGKQSCFVEWSRLVWRRPCRRPGGGPDGSL